MDIVWKKILGYCAAGALAAGLSAGCRQFSGAGASVSDMNAGPWRWPDEAKPKASVSVWLSFGF